MNIISEPTSITALDCNGNAIAGAFQPDGVLTWRLYLTNKLVKEHHRCHPVVCNQTDALQWVTVIAQLYDFTPVERLHLYKVDNSDVSGSAAHLEDQ